MSSKKKVKKKVVSKKKPILEKKVLSKKSSGPWIKEISFDGIDKNLEVVSIIVTTFEHESYDNLFRTVPQKLPEGRVALFSLETRGIKELVKILKNEKVVPKTIPVKEEEEEEFRKLEEKKLEEKIESPLPKSPVPSGPPIITSEGALESFLKEFRTTSSDCVLFNFECCEGCSDTGFPSKQTVDLIEVCMKRGHAMMFSDFAVKSLIKDWDEKKLGPKPFVKIGECQSSMELKFGAEVLVDCGIPQLEAVGKLCDSGTCNIHCLGGTVVFGINWDKVGKATGTYKLEVLTFCSKYDGKVPKKSKYLCEFGKYNGTVGHCILRYGKDEEGGELVVSAGHWIELKKLDTSVETIEKWTMQYGNDYEEEIGFLNDESVSKEEKKKKMNVLSRKFVQQMPSVKSKKKRYKNKRSKY